MYRHLQTLGFVNLLMRCKCNKFVYKLHIYKYTEKLCVLSTYHILFIYCSYLNDYGFFVFVCCCCFFSFFFSLLVLFCLFLLFLKAWFDCIDTGGRKGSWYYIWDSFILFFTGVFPLLLFTLPHLTIQRSKSSWVYSKPYAQRPKEGIFLSAYVVCIFDSFIIIKSTSSTSNNFSWEFVVFRDVDYKLSVNIYKFLLELSEELHPYSWDRKQRISNTTAV